MRKLARKSDHRKLMLRNLLTSLVIFEEITTTRAKGKEVKSQFDKLVNIGKLNNLSARRRLLGLLLHKNAVNKVFEDLAKRYKDRKSGYVRSFLISNRHGDNSPMMLLQLIKDKKTIHKESIEEVNPKKTKVESSNDVKEEKNDEKE